MVLVPGLPSLATCPLRRQPEACCLDFRCGREREGIMSRRAMLMCYAVLVGCFVVGTPAQATPIYFSSVHVFLTDPNPGGTNQNINTGQLLSVDRVAAITASNSEASATGFVNDGVIGAVAS